MDRDTLALSIPVVCPGPRMREQDNEVGGEAKQKARVWEGMWQAMRASRVIGPGV